MKKILLPFFVAVFVVSIQSCKPKTTDKSSSGEVVSKEFPVSDYSYISTTLPVEIVYEQKDTAAYLRLDAEQRIADKVNVTVKDSILHLTAKGGEDFNFKSTSKPVIYTNSKSLKVLAVVGTGDFLLKGKYIAKKLDVRLEGTGDFEADDIQCQTFALTLSGTGDAKLKGKAEAAAYNLVGTGDVKADDFATKSLRVFSKGTGDAQVNVSNYLYVILSGSGDVTYKGKPAKVEKQVSGTGTVEAK